MKPRDFIDVLEDPDAPALADPGEGGRQLLVLLAHLYYADDVIHQNEVKQLRRLVGPIEDADGYLAKLKAQPLDIPKLGEIYPDPHDRDDIVTLAEHAVWGDNDVDTREWDIVDQLVEKLGVIRE